MVEVMKIIVTSFKKSHAHCHTQCPQLCSIPPSTHPCARDSWTLRGKSGSASCGVTAPFSWVLVSTRFCLFTSSFFECEVASVLLLTLCHPMDCSLPGSSVNGILQARILEWVAIPFSRGSSQPRDPACVLFITSGFFPPTPREKALRAYRRFK